MKVLVIFLLGIHHTSAATHTLQYFYTATSGIENFPEFMTAGLVDGQQIDYYDSVIRKAVQKAEWISGAVDPDYWNRNTQTYAGNEAPFKNNIDIAKSRFNQTGGVHTVQLMYGCEVDDDGSTRGYWQYGYDGEDFLSLDKTTLTWTAAKDQAVITKHKWDADKANQQYRKAYLENECIEWVKKYVGYGKDTLERKDAPEVFLLQKDPSSPVLCQATGFYPSNIMMTWQKNKEDHHEDVEVSTTLPNADGTFQKTTTLSVKPEEWKNNKEAYRCVVQHVGAAKDIVVTVKDIRTNPGSDNTIAIIVGCLAAVVVLAAIVGLILWKRSNGYGRASTKDSDSANSDQSLPQVTTK